MRFKIRLLLAAVLISVLAFTGIVFADQSENGEGYSAVILDEADRLSVTEEKYLTDNFLTPLTKYSNVFYVIVEKNRFGNITEDSKYEKQLCDYLYEKNCEKDTNCIIFLNNLNTGWLYFGVYGDVKKPLIQEVDIKYINETSKTYLHKGDYLHFAAIIFGRMNDVLLGLTPKEDYEIELAELAVSEENALKYKNEESGYEALVIDNAELLSPEDRQFLLEVAGKITDQTNAIFVSIDYNPCGKSTSSTKYEREYCSQLYDEHYKKTSETGDYESAVIFLIDMDSRWLYLYRDGPIRDYLTEGMCDIITDNVYTYASDENYYRCASKCFSQVKSVITGKAIEQPMKVISNILIAFCLGFLLTFVFVSIVCKQRKASDSELLSTAVREFESSPIDLVYVRTEKTYSPRESSSGGGGHSSGGHSRGGGFSGGGGGGGFHGGGGGHRF